MTLQLNRRQLIQSTAAVALAGALPAIEDVYDPEPQPERASLGRTYTIPDAVTGLPLMDFTVHSITPAECLHTDVLHEPANGQFLVVSMSALTHRDPEGLLEFLYFYFPWRYRSSSSTPFASTPAAVLCSDAPEDLVANTRYDTTLMVDVPPDAESLIYIGTFGLPGWEWQL